MTEWIIPCNQKYFNVTGAFDKLKCFDWKQTNKNVAVGDIVYIYVGSPVQEIKYKCIINKTNLNEQEIDDTEFVLDGQVYQTYGNYMELELIRKYNNELSLSRLHQLNVSGNIQSPRKVPAELSEYISKLEESIYTPEWFRDKATEAKYKDVKASADKERSEFIKNYGPDVLKHLSGKELLLKIFKGPKDFNGDYLINILERKTNTFGSGNLGNAHNAGLLYKDKQNKWPEPGWAKRKGSNAESISEDEAISLAESVRDALIKSVEYFSGKEFSSQDTYKIAELELKKYFEPLNPVFRYTYIWVIKYIQMIMPNVFPIFYSENWADFVIEKIIIEKPDTLVRKLGSIALFISRCEIDNVTFAEIFYNEIGRLENNKSEWWPSDYETGLTLEDWIDLIDDKTVFTEASLDAMKKLLDIGGEATCSQLAEKYGGTSDHYRNNAAGLAMRVSEKMSIEPVRNKDDELKYWPVLFIGRKAKKDENGSYIWKLCDELKEALIKYFSSKTYLKKDFLKEVFMGSIEYDRLRAVLVRKKNVILQGAPGVGKTFAAKRLVYSVMGEKDESRIEFIQFHQNYSYEDFVMGYKPDGEGFTLTHGVFYQFCKKAADDSEKEYFFIIDEINRGNMSKIFGELLMLIEKDYRGSEAKLAYNGEYFTVPDNLYIIGMMNTADRSLAMIDYALRRRFSFFDIQPGFETQGFIEYQNSVENDLFNEVVKVVIELNKEIEADKSLGSGFCIGHSYFCNMKKCSNNDVICVVEYDILPLLREYWFDDEKSYKYWKDKLLGAIYD